MNCHDMDALLFTGGELPPAAREHLAHCETCRTLAGALGDDGAYTVAPAVLERARGHLPATLAAVQPMAPSGAFTLLFLFLAGAMAAAWAWLKGFNGLPVLTGLQAAAVFGVLLALLSISAF